tara:strand:- start:38 stop:373 length:336 start_codon:yes stop_codon:yes gene_type:complete
MSKPKIVHHIQYQPLKAGADRPEDWGSCHAYSIEGNSAVCQLPQVGDFVNLVPLGASDQYLSFSGKVRSRLFTQFTHVHGSSGQEEPNEIHIGVNIVVEETNDDWGKLIKE